VGITDQIDAIFFDAGGTIRTRVEAAGQHARAIRKIMELIEFDALPDVFDAMLSRRAKNYKRWSVDVKRELTEEEFWTQWMLPEWPAGMIGPLAVQLHQLWLSGKGDFVIRPDAHEVIVELVQRGYRLGLISNATSREMPHELEQLGLSPYFETVVLSGTFGRRKPDISIFLEAVRRMGVSASRSAYVGDKPTRDITGPREAGFALTIIFKEPGAAPADPTWATLVPDYVIHNLSELLTIFPSRHQDD
jgi:HAD superfamily hydrolase (TIGR01509 family)